MNQLCITFLEILLLFISNSNQIEIANDHNETLFRVLESNNQIQLPNRNRIGNSVLRLSLHGNVTQIEKIEKQNSTNWSLELSDKSFADLRIQELAGNLTEYNLHLRGPNKELCFHYGQGFWFNGYQSRNSSWPMDSTRSIPKQQFNYLFDTFKYDSNPTRENIFILEHLFLNSDGFALILDPTSPLFIERISNNNQNDPLLCFSTQAQPPFTMMIHHDDDATSYLDLKITIFAGINARKVVDYVVHESGLVPRPKEMPKDEAMFRNPTWFLQELNVYGNESVNTFSHELTQNGSLGSPAQTHRIIINGWHSAGLDVLPLFDSYPEESLITVLHSHSHQVGVQLHRPDFDQHFDPKVIKYCIKSSPFIDFTMHDACRLYVAKLDHVRQVKGLDAYLFGASTIIGDFEYHDTHAHPSALTTKYVETVAQVSNATIITEYGFKTQHLPVWTRLSNYQHTAHDQLLAELIPSALSVSIAGYSWIVPYSAGGFNPHDKPTEELLIRMAQAATFMPSLSFTAKPWNYNSTKAVEIITKYLKLHTEHAQLIVELAKRRIQDGSPLIRPLWYNAPDDARTYSIGDEYMLGEDILVAPVVRIGQTERTVYLIAGIWIDQHGKSYQGPGEFKVAAPLDELPYFKRKI